MSTMTFLQIWRSVFCIATLFLLDTVQNGATHSIFSSESNYQENRETIKYDQHFRKDLLYGDGLENEDFFIKANQHYSTQKKGNSSASHDHFINILVVADQDVYKMYKESLNDDIKGLFYRVSVLYKHSTIGHRINIALLDDVYPVVDALDSIPLTANGIPGVNGSHLLGTFCKWQNERHKYFGSFDTALLLTKKTLCETRGNITTSCNLLGIAQGGTICDGPNSCMAINYQGLHSADTVAHELAHLMGVAHDNEDYRCITEFDDSDNVENIMRIPYSATHKRRWSTCSRHDLTWFFKSGLGNCLASRKDADRYKLVQNSYQSLAPELYSRNQQCHFMHGKDARACVKEYGENDCGKMICTMSNEADRCTRKGYFWVDRTPCGEGKWCINGNCVEKRPLKPVNGGWSSWGEYGPCSRTCGGGFKKRFRECTNPPPAHGGNYCVGEYIEYETCERQDCPDSSVDHRQEQCDDFIQNTDQNAKWIAEYGHNTYQCILICRRYTATSHDRQPSMKRFVIDGTKCNKYTSDMCFDGICMPSACDNKLYSNAKLDACGVCQGDSSTCVKVKSSKAINTLTDEPVDGSITYQALTIPTGSRYIKIEREKKHQHNLDCLVLRQGEKIILNGEFYNQGWDATNIVEESGNYTGCNTVNEGVYITGPLKLDLTVQVYINKTSETYHTDDTIVSYEYMEPIKRNEIYASEDNQ